MNLIYVKWLDPKSLLNINLRQSGMVTGLNKFKPALLQFTPILPCDGFRIYVTLNLV